MSCCECDPMGIIIDKGGFLSQEKLEIYYWQFLGEICPYCKSKLVAPKWFRDE